MRRTELEHAIRAATEIVEQDQVIIIGSQSILGTWDEDQLPPEATDSIEVDIAPLHDDDAASLATRLDAFIGEWSNFHETHGFYVQGVGRDTAVLPSGWEGRLVLVNGPGTSGRSGLCLEPHDLCMAKLVAHRPKDLVFVAALIHAGLIDPAILSERLDTLADPDPRSVKAITNWLTAQRIDPA